MAVRELMGEEILALVGDRHGAVGFAYPPAGLQPYYEWLIRSLHLLGESSSGELRTARDESGGARVWVGPGRVVLAQSVRTFTGAVKDLSTLNNETAYVWAHVSEGDVAIGAGVSSDGWPGEAHVKLAEVVIEAGEVISITDRRGEGRLVDAHARFGYVMAVETQGDVGTSSVVSIELVDAQGAPVRLADVVRVRVTGESDVGAATSATLAAASGSGSVTTVVETIVAGKDLVVASNNEGRFELTLTNAVAGTAMVRVGAAPVGGRLADHGVTLAVVHG